MLVVGVSSPFATDMPPFSLQNPCNRLKKCTYYVNLIQEIMYRIGRRKYYSERGGGDESSFRR